MGFMNLPGPPATLKSLIHADMRTRRQDYVWLVIFAILLYVLTAGIWHPMPDSTLYINQARNLINGYGLTSGISIRWIASPGYAVLISPFFLINDLPLVALTLFQATLLCIYMLGVYTWASQYTPKSAALIAGAATLHACVWQFGFPTTTEAPFMATLVWAAVCFGQWSEHRQSSQGHSFKFLIAGLILICACTAIRPSGLAIAIGAGVAVILQDRKQKRKLVNTFGMLCLWVGLPGIIVLGFLAREASVTSAGLIEGTYIVGMIPEHSQSVFEMLTKGLYLRISDIGRLTIPGMFKAYSNMESWVHVTMMVYVPFFLAMCWAWVRFANKRGDLLLIGFVPYLILHIVYAHYSDGARFMTPMLPVLMLLFWQLLRTVRLPQHSMMCVVFVIHAVVTIGLAIREQPRLVKIQDQWEIARTCSDLMGDEHGTIQSVEDVNNLELQVMILADMRIRRKRPLIEVDQYKPRWVIRRVSAMPLPHHDLLWSNEEFELFKRRYPVQ